jgi:2-oxoglutarate ferredoxin oxidoreductase subunit beta
VTFNRLNTYKWYSERVYDIAEDASYDRNNKMSAYQKAMEWEEKIPIGIIYKEEKACYEEKTGLDSRPALVDEPVENIDIKELLEEFTV